MSTAATTLIPPRFGSAADVSARTGLSVKTVRRRVKDGTIRGVKLGRRVLIPLDAIDRPTPRTDDHRPRTEEALPVATIHNPAAAAGSYVPAVSADELARRNRALVELLDSWESDGDEQEQRETLAVLRETLGTRRVASSRNHFP